MENPELSLFEALRIGGFDYAADEDASIMDSEKVTLGQRKNQLSRRLRLARKQQEESGNMGGGNGSANASHSNNSHHGIENASLAGLASHLGGLGGAAALDAKVKMQLQQQNGVMSCEAQRQLEKLMQHSQQAKLSSGVKRSAQLAELGPDAEVHLNDDESHLMDEKNSRRMAKFHPQFQQLFVPRAASVRNSFGGGSQLSSQLSSQLTGTPQLGALSPPMTPLTAPPSTSLAGFFPPGLLGQQALSQRSRTGNLPSGVAIASLSNTAQTIGLSLEQLAVALSSSSNLVKVLSNSSGSDQQQELALRLFRNESRALYQRCMLLAGFRPEDAEEKSQCHLQFAFSAWQMEGKRLQELMGDDNGRSRSSGKSTNVPAGATSIKRNNNNVMSGVDGQLNSSTNNTQQQQQLQEEQDTSFQQVQGQQNAHIHGHNSHGQHENTNRHQESRSTSGSTGHSHEHTHSHGHSHEHHVDGHQ